MRWFGALLTLAFALPAQVTVHSALGEAGDRTAERLLEEELPDTRVRLVRYEGTATTGLLLGVDASILDELAGSGALGAVPITDLTPPFLGPGGTYAITLLSPYVIAFNPGHLDPGEIPGDWDDLLDIVYQDRMAIATFQAMPDLWMNWVSRHSERDGDDRRAVGWLTTLDARVGAYVDSAEEVIRALAEGRASLGILPLHLLRGPQLDGLDHVVPAGRAATTGQGVARLGDVEEADAEAVLEVLAGADFNRALADGLRLLAAPRIGEDQSSRSPAERELLANLDTRRWSPALRRGWIELWETEVRGRGRDLESLNEFLDLLLGLLLLAFLFFVYTRIRKGEPS